MSEKSIINPALGSTARWTASARAQESAREDRIFYDPWAAALAGEQGAQWLSQRSGNVAPMVIRTRYFDDFLQRVVRDANLHQVVLVAAGLDTRAYRLNWPKQTQFFELDQPDVLQYKDTLLNAAGAQPTCNRKTIPTDLTGDFGAKLIASGFDPHLPAVWLLEGFLFYLPEASILQILEHITRLSAPGSWMGFDIINAITLTSPITHTWIEMQASMGAPWIGSMDDPEAFLAERGWKASLTQPGSPDVNYGRWKLPVIPVKMPNMPHNWYVTAQKE